MTDSDHGQSPSRVPNAIVVTTPPASLGRLQTRLWWMTGLCVVLAVALVLSSWRIQGELIEVQFPEGHGLKAGDTLRFRGIDVGSVISVGITDDMRAIEVRVQLSPGNASIAVEGSQFWIERPQLRLGQISGLETVVGAKYIGVIPGGDGNRRMAKFVGQATPIGLTSGDSLEIRVQFPAGEGLAVGDPVRYRGIQVGEVIAMELNESVDSVSTDVRLVGSARQLARAGTQFWIERPRLELTEIRGIETIFGGRYLAIQPTLEFSAVQTQFVGLSEPPPMARSDGSLEVELDAPSRLGIVRGAPVTYRGLEAGRVSRVGLSQDGATVKIGVVIDSEYSELVRVTSRWWPTGGVKMDMGLQGMQVSVESFSAWMRGGIAFATPDSPGARVVNGHRFRLAIEADPDWESWQPRIAVGSPRGRNGNVELPKPVRIVTSWHASWLGLYRRRTVESWGLAVSGERLVVPLSFVERARAAGSDALLEVAGVSAAFEGEASKVDGRLAVLKGPVLSSDEIWKHDDLNSSWGGQSGLLVINPDLLEPIAIDAARLMRISRSELQVAPEVSIAVSLAGSPVVDTASGAVVGLLVHSKSGWAICGFKPP